MKSLIRLFVRHRGGAAAVEMALILPFIAAFAVLSASVWDVGQRKQDMGGALKVAAEYYMNGGQDDAAAKAMALAAWQHKPSQADVSITRSCICGGSGAGCTGLCANGTPPVVLVQMTATATTSTAAFAKTQTTQEQVRVR